MTHMMCLFIQTSWKTLWSHEKTHVLVFLFAVFWRHHCGYWQVLQERVRHMGGGGGTALVVDPQGKSMWTYGPLVPQRGMNLWTQLTRGLHSDLSNAICCSGKVEMLMNYEPTWTFWERRVTMNLAAMGGVFVAGLYQRLMKLRVFSTWFCMLTSLVRIEYHKLLAKQLRQ